MPSFDTQGSDMDGNEERLPGWEHEQGSDFAMSAEVLKRIVTAAVLAKIERLRRSEP